MRGRGSLARSLSRRGKVSALVLSLFVAPFVMAECGGAAVPPRQANADGHGLCACLRFPGDPPDCVGMLERFAQRHMPSATSLPEDAAGCYGAVEESTRQAYVELAPASACIDDAKDVVLSVAFHDHVNQLNANGALARAAIENGDDPSDHDRCVVLA